MYERGNQVNSKIDETRTCSRVFFLDARSDRHSGYDLCVHLGASVNLKPRTTVFVIRGQLVGVVVIGYLKHDRDLFEYAANNLGYKTIRNPNYIQDRLCDSAKEYKITSKVTHLRYYPGYSIYLWRDLLEGIRSRFTHKRCVVCNRRFYITDTKTKTKCRDCKYRHERDKERQLIERDRQSEATRNRYKSQNKSREITLAALSDYERLKKILQKGKRNG